VPGNRLLARANIAAHGGDFHAAESTVEPSARMCSARGPAEGASSAESDGRSQQPSNRKRVDPRNTFR